MSDTPDTLSELLRAVHLRGAVFYYVEGAAPWVAEAPAVREIAAAIMRESALIGAKPCRFIHPS